MATVLGFAQTSNAALLAADDFNTGGTDTGFSATDWTGTNQRGYTAGADLSYANYGISQGGTDQRLFSSTGQEQPDRADTRDLASTMDGEIWFTILVRLTDADLGSWRFSGISFHSDTLAQSSYDYSHNLSDLRVGMSPTQLWADWEGAAAGAGWTPDATAGSFTVGTHLILGQMNVGVGTDTLNLWVDPDLTQPLSSTGDLPTATYSNSAIDFTDSIARIGIPIGNTVYDQADAVYLSNTATAFQDVTGVTFVPEPSAALLSGFGALLLLRRRRHA